MRKRNKMIKNMILSVSFAMLATACTVQQPASSQPIVPSAPTSPANPATPPTTAPTVPSSPPVSTAPAGGAPIADATLQNQEWGNAMLVLDIGTDSSSILLACSSGEITAPFKVSGGQFTLPGTYTPEGPPRAIVGPDGTPEKPDDSTTFSGSISGNTMQFTIGNGQPYVLTQGTFSIKPEPCPL